VTAAIEMRGLTKVFGEVRALDGVDLSVASGSVFGFLGPNGAGKTTTLRILTGMARPSGGSATIAGFDVTRRADEVSRRVGYLPDVPGFYDWMRGEEFLRFAGGLFATPKATLDERVEVLLDLAGLAGLKTRIGGYSRGMKQRLGIAQALINAPRVLMLDEPTSALDPIGRKEVLDMVASLRGRTTVFFSTHILSDVERVCDTVAVLNKGRVVAHSSVDELKRRGARGRIGVELESGAGELARALERQPWVEAVTVAGNTLSVAANDVAAARKSIPAVVAAHGLSLCRFDTGETSLEEAFVDLVGDGRQ